MNKLLRRFKFLQWIILRTSDTMDLDLAQISPRMNAPIPQAFHLLTEAQY